MLTRSRPLSPCLRMSVGIGMYILLLFSEMLRLWGRQYRRIVIKAALMLSAFLVLVHVRHSFSVNGNGVELSCAYSARVTGDRILFDNTSYYIRHYPEFICPQNFRNLADWVYGWPETAFSEELEDPSKANPAMVKHLPDGSIIYVKTDQLPSFFDDVYPALLNNFVLITGQGGTQTPGDYVRHLESADTKIIHWFAQNGDIDALRSDRFTHIPVGKLRRYSDTPFR